MGFVKPLLLVALRSTINTEYITQLSWRKIQNISGFIVMVNYAVPSRRLQHYHWAAWKTYPSDIYIFPSLFMRFHIEILYKQTHYNHCWLVYSQLLIVLQTNEKFRASQGLKPTTFQYKTYDLPQSFLADTHVVSVTIKIFKNCKKTMLSSHVLLRKHIIQHCWHINTIMIYCAYISIYHISIAHKLVCFFPIGR